MQNNIIGGSNPSSYSNIMHMIKKLIFNRIADLKNKLQQERVLKLTQVVPPEKEDDLVSRIEELKWMLGKVDKLEKSKFSSKI